MVEGVAKRPSRSRFLSVVAFFVILFLQLHDGWTLPQQIPSEQYQANIYIPQTPTDFSHPSEAGRDYSPPTSPAVNQVPVQEDQLNERPDYENHPNEEDYINERPRGRPYAGSFAEELDGATAAGEDPEKSIPGSPEQDYPVFEEIPRTSFTCRDKPVPAYYADVEARCQVFHICDVGGHKHSFLCPNGSVFNQKYLVCDWWYDFACENAENLFSKQLLPSESTTPDVNNAAQTFSNDGQLIYNQNLAGDYNLNPVYNPGLPQAQLDTPQQVYTGNYYVPQNDIFHGAETGFPGRDQIHANLENAQQNNHNLNVNNNTNLNNENYNNDNNNNNHRSQTNNNNENLNVANFNSANVNNGNTNNFNLNNGVVNNENSNANNNGNINQGNPNNGNLNTGNLNNGNFNNENHQNSNNYNYNKENFNNTNNSNNQNTNKPGEDFYNAENKNNNNNNGKEQNYKSHIDKQPQKLNHEFLDNGKHSNRNDQHNGRKHYKIGRRVQSTTQSSLNLNNREKSSDLPQVFVERGTGNSATGGTPEQNVNIVNDTVGVQRNENNYNNNEQLYRADSNGFNGNNYQTNVNNFNTPTPNAQYIPPNTYREANNNNFQTSQYPRSDTIQ